MKYNEEQIISEINDYVNATYSQHYVGEKEKMQTVDVWDHQGVALEVCVGNIAKYIMRYGKKAGHNRKDLMKLIHYAILAIHFHDERFKDAQTPSTNKPD